MMKMNRKQFLINEIADLVLSRLNENTTSNTFPDFITISQDLKEIYTRTKNELGDLIDKEEFSLALDHVKSEIENIEDLFLTVGFTPEVKSVYSIYTSKPGTIIETMNQIILDLMSNIKGLVRISEMLKDEQY